MDLFCRNNVAREELHNRKAMQDLMGLLEEEKINEFFTGAGTAVEGTSFKVIGKEVQRENGTGDGEGGYPVFEKKNVEGLYKEVLISAKALKKEGMCVCGVWNMVGLEGKAANIYLTVTRQLHALYFCG